MLDNKLTGCPLKLNGAFRLNFARLKWGLFRAKNLKVNYFSLALVLAEFMSICFLLGKSSRIWKECE